MLPSSKAYAQDCGITIEGQVIDEASNTPLSYVNVIIQELSKGTLSDENGVFILENICEGEYHLIASHIGCEPKEMHLHFYHDTIINITLFHASLSLHEIVVRGKADNLINQPTQAIGKQAIQENINESLAGLLENEAGVQMLRNGGIGKPIVHGLFGNRLTILNNGVMQSGQQWGNDHSPEIDPLIANRITVVKGTNALEYGGGNLGSIILVEPQKISREPHLHGRFNYAFETNGRGNNVNIQLQKYAPALAWRLNGTLKKYGDRKSPNYFLNNTGSQEANLALQLEKSWKDKFFLDFYASTFNTELGVLRGSHIGNLTDLEQALTRTVPFFTEPEFSSIIEAPKQKVAHHLVKLNSKYQIDNSQFLQFTLAGQMNNRKEFDVRRSGRTDIPALSLEQFTFSTDLKYQKEFDSHWLLKIGNQTFVTDNTNNPETGILPLIPDYSSLKSGVFAMLNREWMKATFNLGLRYDYELQKVVAISNTVPRQIIRYENNFSNISGVMGFKYNISDIHSLTANTGYAMRNPAINELYSNGLHQGVSGIEEGDINLKTEKAVKSTLEYKLLLGSKFSFGSLFYYQRFRDYIFLSPQDDIRLTIRGAFPVFKYEQTNAEIYGMDIYSKFSLGQSIVGELRYSYIKGNDRRLKESDINNRNIPLVNIPSNSLFTSLTYRNNRSFSIDKIKIEDVELAWTNRLVFKQDNLLPEQDFVLPPDTYHLMGAKFSANLILPQFKLRFFAKVDNLLNINYRDYLNRQRYFADDLGLSTTLGLNFIF